MTAQMSDLVYFNNERWYIIASTSDFKVNPNDYGLRTIPASTACWDGFLGVYQITKSLYIKKLWVNLHKKEFPVFLGVEATQDNHHIYFDHCYELNKKIDFTGTIMVGKDIIPDYYTCMGYQKIYAYQLVYEIVFEGGTLITVYDCSKCVEKLREDIEAGHNNSLIHEYFSTDYEAKKEGIEKYDYLKEVIDLNSI